MFQRLADARLRVLWRQFPAVLILGARQVGKTTLAQMVFPDARKLQNAARDLGARTAWIIDQAGGAERVAPHIERRGMGESLDWLPE